MRREEERKRKSKGDSSEHTNKQANHPETQGERKEVN